SLRLLTPNWLSRLPDVGYDGPEPDGYMSAADVVELIDRFAAPARACVRTATNVTSVRRTEGGYHGTSSRGERRTHAVVLASGACTQPAVPGLASAVPGEIEQLTPFGYQNPAQLPD